LTEEEINVVGDGEFVFDLFLFPSFADEDEILADTGEISVEEVEEKKGFAKYSLWSYLIALGIFLIAIGRVILARKKYGRLRKGRKKKEEVNKIVENEELSESEGEDVEGSDYLEEALEIIKKNEGRISQKKLRKEMMHLSEAKISLILTELEHKGKIEKIKKGRGNVVILK